MGAVDFYLDERSAREVETDAFAIQRGPVTVAQLARFVDQTGYVTLAERVPDPVAYPDADSSLLVPGSAVFHPTPGPVGLHHPVTHIAYQDADTYAHCAGQTLQPQTIDTSPAI